MQRDWLGEKVAACGTDPNLCTGFQGNLIARDHKGPAGRDPWLNHATQLLPHDSSQHGFGQDPKEQSSGSCKGWTSGCEFRANLLAQALPAVTVPASSSH